jgi:hypothetical protein
VAGPAGAPVDSRRQTDRQRGAGLFSTTFGLAVTIGFLLFGANISVALYSRSVATAVAQDLARDIALLGPNANQGKIDSARQQAEGDLSGLHGTLQASIGGLGCQADEVCVHVVADSPSLSLGTGLNHIDRVVRARIERQLR